MKTQELKYVTRRRAAVLLGLSEQELNRISSESGFGHKEVSGQEEETYFTYEELRQICMLAVNHVNRTGRRGKPAAYTSFFRPPSVVPRPGRSPQRPGFFFLL